jgi:hypothetical protein
MEIKFELNDGCLRMLPVVILITSNSTFGVISIQRDLLVRKSITGNSLSHLTTNFAMYKRGHVHEVISLILLRTRCRTDTDLAPGNYDTRRIGLGGCDDLASVRTQLVFEALGTRGYRTQQMRSSSSETLSKGIG